MHRVTIARTKDFPFSWKVLESILTYDGSYEQYAGKWEQIYANQEEFVAENIDDINKLLEENGGNFDEALSICLRMQYLRVGDDKALYQNMSAIFDYCELGGRFVPEDQAITQYKNLVKQDIDVDVFVMKDCSVHYTNEEECPFDADDMVYIIDGHI